LIISELSEESRALITAWLEVRVLPGPPISKIKGLAVNLAAVATAIGDRFFEPLCHFTGPALTALKSRCCSMVPIFQAGYRIMPRSACAGRFEKTRIDRRNPRRPCRAGSQSAQPAGRQAPALALDRTPRRITWFKLPEGRPRAVSRTAIDRGSNGRAVAFCDHPLAGSRPAHDRLRQACPERR